MARPTRLAAELAKATGEPASRVQRWIEDGYGPATPEIDAVEHFRHLVPLMGTGKNGNVAVLKMAADGYPCRRLRTVLASLTEYEGPDTNDPQELVEYLMGDPTATDLRDLMLAQARKAPVPPEWELGDSPEAEMSDAERADLTTRAMALPAADLTVGSLVDPYDYAEHYRLSEAVVPTGEPFDDASAQIMASLYGFVRETARTARTWIENASPGELARGVAAARMLVDAGMASVPGLDAWGDEAKWRRIGLLAAVASPMLELLLAVVGMIPTGTAMSPAVRAYVSALEQPQKPLAGEGQQP